MNDVEPTYTLSKILGFQRDPVPEVAVEPKSQFFVVIAHPDEILGTGLKTITSTIPRVALSYAFPRWDSAAAMLEPGRHLGKFTDVLIVTDTLVQRNQRVAAATRAAGAKIIVLLDDLDAVDIVATAGLEADGFLLTSALTVQALSEVFRQLDRSQIPMPSGLTRGLLAEVDKLKRANRRPHLLTPRELETLRLLVEGLGNKQIAQQLGIGVNGVKRHVSNVLAKLNCPNRTQAAAYAVRAGLI